MISQWIAVVGTALGAVIGLGSAVLNDRMRWRREQVKEQTIVRRDMYANYIAALTETHEKMRAVSRLTNLESVGRMNKTYDVFTEGRGYELRYQIVLVADQKVLDCSEQAFRRMRDIRDLIAAGVGVDDPQYQPLRDAWGDALRDLQMAVREELGSGPVVL